MKTKTKKIKLTTILLALVVGFVSCEKFFKTPENPQNICIKERPENLKSIDWDNYNDVYTVYWTYHDRSMPTESWIYKDTAKIIKVYGWLPKKHKVGDFYGFMEGPGFRLVTDKDSGEKTPYVYFVIVGDSVVIDALKAKLATADLTKKCYIRGEFCFKFGTSIDAEWGGCFLIIPRIKIYSADDVYFECCGVISNEY